MSLEKIIYGKNTKDSLGRSHPIKRKIITKCDYCGKISREKNYIKKTAEKKFHFCNASCSQKHKFATRKTKLVNMYFCPICGEVFMQFKHFFERHLRKSHNIDINVIDYKETVIECDKNMSPEEIYIKHILNGILPKCKCGCGEEVKNPRRGAGYVAGHAIRVHNNWGHNSSALAKSQETRREMHKNGEIEIWNAGLTKETDERLAKYGKGISDAFTDERKVEYSERMRKNRLDGTVQTLYGPEHSQWNGGVSTIAAMSYSSKKLYTEWKFPILVNDEFKCSKCGSTDNLQVHHNDIGMSDIARIVVKSLGIKILDPTNIPHDEKRLIKEHIIQYHIDNAVSGITLCYDCHKEVHPSLNFKSNQP
jgi:hypothetical protein